MKKVSLCFFLVCVAVVFLSLGMVVYIHNINQELQERLESVGSPQNYEALLEECRAEYAALQDSYEELEEKYNNLYNSGYDIFWGDSEASEDAADDPTSYSENTFFIESCAITYEKTEIVYNMADEKCIAIFFTFENKSDESKTFDYLADITAFQSGVEIEMSLWHVSDESKNGELEIKPGTTVTVANGFVLRDSSDVTFEVEEWISFDNDPLFSITVPAA